MTFYDDTKFLLTTHTEVWVDHMSSNGTTVRDQRICEDDVIQAVDVKRVDTPNGDLRVFLKGGDTYTIDWKDVQKFQVFAVSPVHSF